MQRYVERIEPHEEQYADDAFDVKPLVRCHEHPTDACFVNNTFDRIQRGELLLSRSPRDCDWKSISRSHVQGQRPLDWVNADRFLFDEQARHEHLRCLVGTGTCAVVSSMLQSPAYSILPSDERQRRYFANESWDIVRNQQGQISSPCKHVPVAPWAAPPIHIDVSSIFDAVRKRHEGGRFDAAL